MSCCGGKRRREAHSAHSTRSSVNGGRPPGLQVVEREAILFEYTGRTALSVRGPMTGRPYRFAGPGMRVSVDARDAAAVAGVPNLRRVGR